MTKFISFDTFWKDSSLILKIFTGLSVYSVMTNLWSLISIPNYMSSFNALGIEGNLLLNYFVYIMSLVIGLLFILAVLTKSKTFFYIHLASGLYIPFALFFTWMNRGSKVGDGIFYLVLLLMLALMLTLLYNQKKYFSK